MFLFFQQMRSHLPVTEMGHEQHRASAADDLLQLLPALTGAVRLYAPGGEESVIMDGGEVLKLPEYAKEVKKAVLFRIESGKKAQAFPSFAGNAEIAGGNKPGDKNKKPAATEAATLVQNGVPETGHGNMVLKMRAKISREKVAELR